MKTLSIAAPILFLFAAFAVQVQSHAQATIDSAAAAATATGLAPTGAASVDSAYTVVARDGNHKLWSKLSWETNALTGEAIAKTNSYIELATASARLVNGLWIDYDPQIQLTDTGAQSTNSHHTVSFLGNINGPGAVDITLPGQDKHLAGTVIGLAYEDLSTGKSVLIGELKDSQGQLLPSGREVLYPDAFTDFEADAVHADVLYINTVSSFEQLVIIRQQLPSPSEWGLDPGYSVLQVITAFDDPPQPKVTERKLAGAIDQNLDFGIMQMGRGVAFALGARTNTIPSTKKWLVLDSRQCLIEQTQFKLLQPLLNQLPAPSGHAGLKNSPDPVIHRVASVHLLPERKPASATTIPLKVANLAPESKGVALDYTIVEPLSGYRFRSDTTYYVPYPVMLFDETVIEGGAVIKFTNDASTTATALILSGTLKCETSPYRMGILTSMDDNSVGQIISGSTGSPTNANGANFLLFGSGAYKYLRFSYGKPSGDLDADFGFTGHFVHPASGLHLALFRAYDAAAARWLSRDPIEEDGGPNAYSYVGNDPLGSTDPAGLARIRHHRIPSRWWPEADAAVVDLDAEEHIIMLTKRDHYEIHNRDDHMFDHLWDEFFLSKKKRSAPEILAFEQQMWRDNLDIYAKGRPVSGRYRPGSWNRMFRSVAVIGAVYQLSQVAANADNIIRDMVMFAADCRNGKDDWAYVDLLDMRNNMNQLAPFAGDYGMHRLLVHMQ